MAGKKYLDDVISSSRVKTLSGRFLCGTRRRDGKKLNGLLSLNRLCEDIVAQRRNLHDNEEEKTLIRRSGVYDALLT